MQLPGHIQLGLDIAVGVLHLQSQPYQILFEPMPKAEAQVCWILGCAKGLVEQLRAFLLTWRIDIDRKEIRENVLTVACLLYSFHTSEILQCILLTFVLAREQVDIETDHHCGSREVVAESLHEGQETTLL